MKTVFSPTTKEVLEAKSENEEIIDEAETLLKEFDKEIQEHFNRTGKTLTEVSEDEPIQISSCFKKQLLSWYSKFENNTKKYNQLFNEFKNKTSKYSNTNYFRLSFTSLPEKTKEYTEELNRIKQMINLVKSSTEKKNVNKKISCALLYTGTKPLTFTRKELKTVLMSSANYVSVSLLNNMIDQYLAKSKSLNTKQSIESLIKFSTELNAEVPYLVLQQRYL